MFAWRDNFISFASSANDPYWSSVSYLSNYEAPSLAFVDNTTGNFAFSTTNPTGVRPSLNTPVTGGGSVYFDGLASTSYISSPANAAFSVNATDFTIEAYVWKNSISDGDKSFAGIFAAANHDHYSEGVGEGRGQVVHLLLHDRAAIAKFG